MPCTKKSRASSSAKRRRALKCKEKDRYHCPYPGCARSCAELWRLKVHYRAPSNIRGSGVERGHDAELEFCPKCKEKLEVGKNHSQCRPGNASRQPRQEQGRVQGSVHEVQSVKGGAGSEPSSTGQPSNKTQQVLALSSSEDVLQQEESPSVEEVPDIIQSLLQAEDFLAGQMPVSFSSPCFPTCNREVVDSFSTQMEPVKTPSLFQGLFLDCEEDEEVLLPKDFYPSYEQLDGFSLSKGSSLSQSEPEMMEVACQAHCWPCLMYEPMELPAYEANVIQVGDHASPTNLENARVTKAFGF